MPDVLDELIKSLQHPLQPKAELRPIPADFAQATMNFRDKYKSAHPIPVSDKRPGVAATQRVHAEVSPEMAQALIAGAKRHGEDPATVLAMAMQETGFGGGRWAYNPLHDNHVDIGKFPHDLDHADQYARDREAIWDPIKDMEPVHRGMVTQARALNEMLDLPDPNLTPNTIDAALRDWKQRQQAVPDASPALKIQAYNGLGKVSKGYYGQTTQTDMRKTPLYGERVIALRDSSINTNPALRAIIDQLTQKREP